MLYYILLPIIMVISLALLIFFINRKISAFPEDMFSEKQNEIEKDKIAKKTFFFKMSNSFLYLLEKITKRFKLIFLQFHNKSEKWSHAIKEKKLERLEKREQHLQEEKDASLEELNKNEDSVAREKEVAKMMVRKKISPRKIVSRLKMIEREIPPMVSEKATLPEKESKEKSEYEKILIERIAMNPRDIEAYERLGDYYFKQNNLSDTEECYKQVLKLSPGNRKAKLNIRKIENMKVK